MLCERTGCGSRAVYELLWDTYDDQGTLEEEDNHGTVRYSCKSLDCMLRITRGHTWGPPVDSVSVWHSDGYRGLPKLTRTVNSLAIKQ